MEAQDQKLTRFLEAQHGVYENALGEIRNGKKTGHWMWFIFPQLAGLGFSEMAKFYGIQDKNEADDYLNHPVLGRRLIEISNELLKLNVSNAARIFGEVDSIKLKSSMTLFALTDNTNPVFGQVLQHFYRGDRDEKTVLLLFN